MTNKNEFSTAIHFNHKNRTIEITKAFDKASSMFGTEEFKALQDAVAFAPTYKVVVKNRKTGDANKGLTYEFMERYIKNHDDADGSIWKEYRTLRGYDTIDGEEIEVDESKSYGEIKMWFLACFKEIGSFNAKRNEMLEAIKNKNAEKKREKLSA